MIQGLKRVLTEMQKKQFFKGSWTDEMRLAPAGADGWAPADPEQVRGRLKEVV